MHAVDCVTAEMRRISFGEAGLDSAVRPAPGKDPRFPFALPVRDDLEHPRFLRLAHGIVVSCRWEADNAARSVQSSASQPPSCVAPPRAAALLIEDRVRAASLSSELRSHPPWR